MSFRELVADLDDAVVRDLADDDIIVDGEPVRGMFAAPWLGPDLGRQRTQLEHPQVSVRDVDAARVVQGSVVIVGSDTYVVFELQPDGTGWTVLLLRPR
ncbi:head-tail joining protein [Paraburkholderia sp. D1E]|uniref:head-tail joining protein n=1 Tax=Paraburkholderia sp. D1E TaxID=3461398 RepID=UPI004045C5B3